MNTVDTTHALPAGPTRSRWRTLGVPLLVGGAAAGSIALLHVRDPHVQGSYGICPFYALTGLWCPGCGGLRAVHNLTDGRLLDAVHSNVLVLPLLVGFAVVWGRWALRRWRGLPPNPFPFAMSWGTLWIIVAVLTAFTVLRNTPWGTWLAPV